MWWQSSWWGGGYQQAVEAGSSVCDVISVVVEFMVGEGGISKQLRQAALRLGAACW
jgi:hypothetical protein